ncbi:MAG: Rho termination factor N-terminal domain-containing protein [Actinomycetes bacterium]
MSVLNREALEASPLADLHEIAADLGVDGYRRLRKADLVDRLLETQGGGSPSEDAADPAERPAPRSRSREREPRSRQREPRGGEREQRSREPRSRERSGGRAAAESSEPVEGTLSIQSSGSGFIAPKGGGDEVYVSAAQIRRLELSEGDVIGGPTRAARRSEKHPSLVRVETINGKSADEVTPPVPGKESPRREKAAAKAAPSLPTERVALSGDETLSLIDRVAPIGKGSRVVLHGGPHSGKSTAARGIASALRSAGVEVFTVLSGVRAEEAGDWAALEPAAVESLDSSPDGRAKAVERVLEKAKRAAGKNGNAALVVDSVDDLPGAAVRKTLAAAGCTPGGGSLTVVAVASAPLGGETTVVGFDQARAAAGKFPSVRVRSSSTLKPELLLDARSLKASRKAHADAVKKER